MGKSCAIIHRIKNKDGQIVDSKLFKSLLNYFDNNREYTKKFYYITKNEEFIKDYSSRLSLDENGEFTISSLLKNTNLNSFISEEKVLEKLNKEIQTVDGIKDKTVYIDNKENNKKLQDRAIRFNNNSEFNEDYVALVKKFQDKESGENIIKLQVEKRTRENSIEANNMEYNSNLNSLLRNILSEHGVSIGSLTELEERLSINGVTDFSTAKEIAKGAIEMIRLANGIRGEKALPEEFAHWAIEAMGENPLISRLINHLYNNGLVKEILGEEYEDYYKQYKEDNEKLAKEAAGKLLAKHLLNNETTDKKPYKNIIDRVIQAVKDFFKKINASKIERAMIDADKNFGKLARDIINRNLDEQMSIDNIKSDEQYYQLAERIKRDQKLLRNITDNELKRLKIYEKRNLNSSFEERQRLLIDELETRLAKNEEIEGIYKFLESALSELGKIKSRFITISNTPAVNLNERAKVLRDIRNYLYSYGNIIEEIRDSLLEEEKLEDNRYGDRIRIAIDKASALNNDLFIEYNKASMPIFIEFIKPYLGENIEIPFGKFKGKAIKAEYLVMKPSDIKDSDPDKEFILSLHKDISFFDRWLDSMAESRDYMLKIMDKANKKEKDIARQETLEDLKKLQAAAIKLEQSGVKRTEWMFERDNEGNLTGNYISAINHGEYRRRREEMLKKLQEKYGKHPTGESNRLFKMERNAWYEENNEIINGVRTPKESIYGNSVFKTLSSSQQEFYTTIMQIKKSLDALLPDNATRLLNTIKIRKDLVERAKSSGISAIFDTIKDMFIKRSDDTDFGGVESKVIKDFEEREVMTLPIYYIKLKEGESNNDISTDIVSTMVAYAAMAHDFDHMNKVIDVLELSRDVLRKKEIVQTKSDKPAVEKFKTIGRTVESTLIKEKGTSHFMAKLNDFFDSQIYGKYMKDEGTFGDSNVDKGKTANFINLASSISDLGLNLLAGISNIVTGKVMMRIESFAGEFFTEKDTLIADKNYGKYLPEFLGEIGNRVRVGKLALWNEKMNVLQEYEKDIKDIRFDRKSWFNRLFSLNTIFFINNCGEHWMQTRTSLALANTYKMIDPNGKKVSLFDAMEVVYIDPNNKKLGARLEIKEGYTKEDGSQFTSEDLTKFVNKVKGINQRMHGIYNKADMNAVQRTALGRMAILYRKWVIPAFNRRFARGSYNMDLEMYMEGYYLTAGKFLWQLIKDIRHAQFNLAANWNNLSKHEKANFKRALTEIAHFLIISCLVAFINWPDDDESPWVIKMAEYQCRRLKTELGAMTPTPYAISEGFKMFKSPAAGLNFAEDVLGLIGLMGPWNYMDEIQSGRYKGHSSAYKIFFDSRIVPMNKTIYGAMHPEERMQFFK